MKFFSVFFSIALIFAISGCAALINKGTNKMHTHNWGQEVPGKSFVYYDDEGRLHLLDFGSEACNKGEKQDINVRATIFAQKSNYPMATSILRECILINGKDSILPTQTYNINQERFMILASRDSFLLEPNKDEKGFVVGAFKVLTRKSTGKGYRLYEGLDCGSAVAHLEKKHAAEKEFHARMNRPYKCGSCKGTGQSSKCLACNGIGYYSDTYLKMGSFTWEVDKGTLTTTTTKSKELMTFPDCTACVGGEGAFHNCTVCEGRGCVSCEDEELNKANGITPIVPKQ